MILEIPEEVFSSAKIPRPQLESELLRRLASALYADGVIGGGSACKLAMMGKAEFQYWLGEHGVIQPMEYGDYKQERENLEEWLNNA